MRRLGRVVLEFSHPPVRNGHGDIVPGATPPPFQIEGCSVAPVSTTEADGTASTTSEVLSALIPADRLTFNSKMTVLYDGDVYHVKGKPMRWTFMAGGPAGTELHLTTESDR